MPIIPPDSREEASFDVTRLWKNLDRQNFKIVDPNVAGLATPPSHVEVGEPVRQLSDDATTYALTSEVAYAINDGDDHAVGMMAATNDQAESVLGISFTKYSDDITTGGWPDAVENQAITVLKGQFQAKLNRSDWFSEGAVAAVGILAETCAPGKDVIVFDAAIGGVKYRCLSNSYVAHGTAGSRYEGYATTTMTYDQLDNCVIGKVDKTNATHAWVTFNIK